MCISLSASHIARAASQAPSASAMDLPREVLEHIFSITPTGRPSEDEAYGGRVEEPVLDLEDRVRMRWLALWHLPFFQPLRCGLRRCGGRQYAGPGARTCVPAGPCPIEGTAC